MGGWNFACTEGYDEDADWVTTQGIMNVCASITMRRRLLGWGI